MSSYSVEGGKVTTYNIPTIEQAVGVAVREAAGAFERAQRLRRPRRDHRKVDIGWRTVRHRDASLPVAQVEPGPAGVLVRFV